MHSQRPTSHQHRPVGLVIRCQADGTAVRHADSFLKAHSDANNMAGHQADQQVVTVTTCSNFKDQALRMLRQLCAVLPAAAAALSALPEQMLQSNYHSKQSWQGSMQLHRASTLIIQPSFSYRQKLLQCKL